MLNLTVLYHTPTDLQAFTTYYFEKHVPIAKQIPGLLSYTVSEGPVSGADGKPAQYPLIANLTFESPEAYLAAMTSPEGAAAGSDIANFATGGVTILSYSTKPV